jgi:hypothetical protein
MKTCKVRHLNLHLQKDYALLTGRILKIAT